MSASSPTMKPPAYQIDKGWPIDLIDHFMNEETEALRGKTTYLRIHS